MDLRTAGRMLYISPADVSVGNGPGVNENEFIHALYAAASERAHFLVPRPIEPVDDLPLHAIIRIDEVQKHGASRISVLEGGNVTPFPATLYPVGGDPGVKR